MLRRTALVLWLLLFIPAVLAQILTPGPTDSGAWQPDQVTFEAATRTPRRGDLLRVTWNAPGAGRVRIETYDIDYFPRYSTRPPLLEVGDLPPVGTFDLPIPAQAAGGGGWQIHLIAEGPAPQSLAAYRRIDVLFADVPQPVIMRAAEFTLPPGPLYRGDAALITWQAQPLVRGINEAGIVDYLPAADFDAPLFIEMTCIADMAATPGTALNARFTGLTLEADIAWTVPDFPPWCTGILFNLGWETDSGPVIIDTRWVELRLRAPVSETVGAAYQPFERGFMIWNGQNGEVRVFVDDGRAEVYGEAMLSEMIESPLDEAPPAGRSRPVNAFAIVWSNYYFPYGALGWATAPEQGYSMTLTYTTGGAILFTLPDGRQARIQQGAWSWW